MVKRSQSKARFSTELESSEEGPKAWRADQSATRRQSTDPQYLTGTDAEAAARDEEQAEKMRAFNAAKAKAERSMGSRSCVVL